MVCIVRHDRDAASANSAVLRCAAAGALAYCGPPSADCEGGADIPVCPSRAYATLRSTPPLLAGEGAGGRGSSAQMQTEEWLVPVL